MDYAQVFLAANRAPSAACADVLYLPHWAADDWNNLLRRARARSVHSSEIVIARGAEERSVCFVVAGQFEVGSVYVDGMSFSPLARIGPGSVLGEQSFFDGLPRSANVWAITEGELLVLQFEDYRRFSDDAPALARDLVFAMSRVLSLRLRNTTVRSRR